MNLKRYFSVSIQYSSLLSKGKPTSLIASHSHYSLHLVNTYRYLRGFTLDSPKKSFPVGMLENKPAIMLLINFIG